MTAASGLAPGDELGKYRLERLLGAGGMGEVWAARDPDLDRRVALKVLRKAVADDDDAQARLLREARAMARLRHPNVITVHEATSAGGRDIVAMELIDGHSLHDWLAAEPRPRDQIVAKLLAAGRGLAAAHAAGMVHRDFKPHNVLVDGSDGRVLVTDFGLARAMGDDPRDDRRDDAAAAEPADPTERTPGRKGVGFAETVAVTPAPLERTATAAPSSAPRLVSGAPRSPVDLVSGASARRTATTQERASLDSPLTRTGAILGTPAYMAPEQFAGRPADDRADQFAFCVTAWEALAGARPFTGRTFDELADAVEAGAVHGAGLLPRRLRKPLLRGLSRDPRARWPSMDALLSAIDRAWKRPRRLAIAGGALVAAGGVAAAIAIARAPATSSACSDSATAVAPAWSPALRADVARLLGDVTEGDRNRVLGFFDGWATGWRTLHDANCRRPDAPDFSATRTCLESIRDEVASMMELRATIPSDVLSNVELSLAVPSVKPCVENPRANTSRTPIEPAKRAEANAIRTDLVTLRSRSTFAPAADMVMHANRLVERARALGARPVVAEALQTVAVVHHLLAQHRIEPGSLERAYEAYRDAAVEAETIGNDRIRAQSLLGQIECAENLHQHADEIDDLIRSTTPVVARLADPITRYMFSGTRGDYAQNVGRWTETVDAFAEGRRLAGELGLERREAQMMVREAEARSIRHHGDDLKQAIGLVAQATAIDGDWRRSVATWITWASGGRLGRGDAAIAEPEPIRDPIAIDVRVVDRGGRAVADASIAAALGPLVDDARFAIVDPVIGTGPIAFARSGADGRVVIAGPPGGVVVVDHASGVALVPVPDKPGDVAITVAPPARIAGVVRGAWQSTAVDTSGLDERAARRTLPFATLSRIDPPAATYLAPIDDGGRWKLERVPAGRYIASVEVGSALGDTQAAQSIVDARTGVETTVELELATPRATRVITRPPTQGLVVVFPGDRAPATIADLQRALASAAWSTLAFAGPPIVRADPATGARMGDGMNVIGVLRAGPVVACTILASSRPWTPINQLVAADAAPPPSCKAVTVPAVGDIPPIVIVTETPP